MRCGHPVCKGSRVSTPGRCAFAEKMTVHQSTGALRCAKVGRIPSPGRLLGQEKPYANAGAGLCPAGTPCINAPGSFACEGRPCISPPAPVLRSSAVFQRFRPCFAEKSRPATLCGAPGLQGKPCFHARAVCVCVKDDRASKHRGTSVCEGRSHPKPRQALGAGKTVCHAGQASARQERRVLMLRGSFACDGRPCISPPAPVL